MRHKLGPILVVGVLVAAAACSSSGGGRPDPGTKRDNSAEAAGTTNQTAGLVTEKAWMARQNDYLKFATAKPVSGGDPLSLIAHAEAAARAGKKPDLSAVSVADFEPIFAKLKAYTDTGDFDVNRLITLWASYHRDLPKPVADAIKTRILAFKYWWTEPTPKGIVDSQYYWTENHQIIYLANEYVAGQLFPNDTFTNSGMTGKQHVAHAETFLAKWFELRSRFGFSEWLSNVYWNEDMVGLLLLAEYAQEPAMARRASMMLDVLFVELAGHVQKGTFGSTHGRTYQKNKLNGRDEDTFSTTKMVFDRTPVPYANADSTTLLARAHRYRPPEVARKIAASQASAVFRLRAGIPLDPLAPVDPTVKAPDGLSFTGDDALMTWWAMGAQFPWQIAPLSARTVKKYDLFKTSNFQQAKDLAPVVENSTDDALRNLARSLAIQVNPGLVSQVDTYTWRSPGVMLSTAEDWRPGQKGAQDHIWQATIDPDTLVFTQHPSDPVPSTADASGDSQGYWTGDGAMPRSAQWNNVGVSVYSPLYGGSGGVGSGAFSFTYEPYTHAFFPTEHFDQVVQRNGWTIGRKGGGYIALWSQRPTHWRQYSPGEFTNGLTKPFDLIADGGPDDVWVTEVADGSQYAKAGPTEAVRFNAFVAAITAAPVQVTPGCQAATSCPTPATGTAAGATVRYRSPSQGEVSFGWHPGAAEQVPLTVAGKTIDLHADTARWDAPYAKAASGRQRYHASLDGATLDLDFAADTRRTTR
jgi:hypothetical protein